MEPASLHLVGYGVGCRGFQTRWAAPDLGCDLFDLEVLPLSRIISGRLLRGWEVRVHCWAFSDDNQEGEVNHCFWGSVDLLTSAHDVTRFLARCASEYYGQPVAIDAMFASLISLETFTGVPC